jgi:hypothetical protein
MLTGLVTVSPSAGLMKNTLAPSGDIVLGIAAGAAISTISDVAPCSLAAGSDSAASCWLQAIDTMTALKVAILRIGLIIFIVLSSGCESDAQ